MKKFLILLINFWVVVAYCQTPPILRTVTLEQSYQENYSLKKGDYIKDSQNTLNKYIGTWTYSNNGTVFTLKLERINVFLIPMTEGSDFYYYKDIILVRYKLVRNGQVVFDNLNSPSGTSLTIDENRGVLNNIETNDYIDGIFYDFTNNVFVSRCEITKLINAIGQPQKIYFKLYPNHSRRMNPPSFYQGMTTMYSMPSNIELTKID